MARSMSQTLPTLVKMLEMWGIGGRGKWSLMDAQRMYQWRTMPGAWVEEQKKGWEEWNSFSLCVFMSALPHLMLFGE